MAPSATTPPNEQNTPIVTKGEHVTPQIDVWSNYSNWIDGKPSKTAKTLHGINPATKEALPEVPHSTKEDVDNAVKAARAAFKLWKKVPFAERQKAVTAYADALEANQVEFATLLTTEQGKPLAQAQGEIAAGYIWLRELAKINLEDTIVEEDDTKKTITRYTPLGVSVGIVPWNFPVHLATGKIAAALVTGNTMIIKPSPFTPYSDIKLVELGQQFFPPGVLQILSGGDDLGPMLTAHEDVDKISFTGSTATGKKVMESASKTLKRVTLELGGNDPAIVCEDVDIDSTAAKVATFAFLNSSQICIALKRIYVQDTIYDKFRDAMVKFITATHKVGNGLDQATTHGPIQNKMQYERVQGFYADIEKEGWKVAAGGKNDDKAPGYFINPTIIDNPADDSRIVVEEPFGPIVPLLKWHSEDEVIARANDTKMGLGASVWTRNLEQGERIATQIEAGSVWINTHLEVSPHAAFGGHKHSGMGHEWGKGGLIAYCNTQTLFFVK